MRNLGEKTLIDEDVKNDIKKDQTFKKWKVTQDHQCMISSKTHTFCKILKT